jgi:hypothetical protein
MKTAIIRNHSYDPYRLKLDDTYDFAAFELTPEFFQDIDEALALSASESNLALAEYHRIGSPRTKPILRGHIYQDPCRLTYFNRKTLQKIIDLREFDEAEDSGHILIFEGTLPEEIREECLYTMGAYLETGCFDNFRWHNRPTYGNATLFTDWIYRDNKRLILDEENSSPTHSLTQISEPTAAPEASERPASDFLTLTDLVQNGRLSDKLAKELTRGLSFTKSAGQRRYLNASIQDAICSKLASSSIRKDTRKKLESTLDWLRN